MEQFIKYINECIVDAYNFYLEQDDDSARSDFEDTLRSLLNNCVQRNLPESEIHKIFDPWELYNPYRDWVED